MGGGVLGPIHPLYLVGTGSVFPGGKGAGAYKAGVEVNKWSCTATPIRFRGVLRDN
jgi:hypothetical protein